MVRGTALAPLARVVPSPADSQSGQHLLLDTRHHLNVTHLSLIFLVLVTVGFLSFPLFFFGKPLGSLQGKDSCRYRGGIRSSRNYIEIQL